MAVGCVPGICGHCERARPFARCLVRVFDRIVLTLKSLQGFQCPKGSLNHDAIVYDMQAPHSTA